MGLEDNYFFNNFRQRNFKFVFDDISGFILKRLIDLKFWQKFFLAVFLFFGFFYFFFISAPIKSFSTGVFAFEIQEGVIARHVGKNLKEEKLIRSPVAFNFVIKLIGGENKIKAGKYQFEEKQNLFKVIWRIVEGEEGYEPIRLLVPEGTSVEEIALLVKDKKPDFNHEKFVYLAKNEEGYLFPDTYFLPPGVLPETLIRIMKNNFENKIETLKEDLEKSGQRLADVVIMASILEKEARTTRSRQIIAGILWERLKIGMPLQVDAVFLYINGKSTYDLTMDDLRDESSLYNTYVYRGLPPGPITNPGLDSIWSALNPIKTNYLYYLSDKSGRMYYAETFEEHIVNKQKYMHLY